VRRGPSMLTRRCFLGSATALGTSIFIPSRAGALQEGEPSRTAQSAALHRAAHQLMDVPLVFADPLGLRIIGPERRRWLEVNLARRQLPQSRAMRAFIVARSRLAEDELAAAQGMNQYVVLGAGLDTFGYRNRRAGSLKVFEVDHPATQGWKRKQLQEVGIDIPHSLHFVAVDFEKERLADRLQSSGFDPAAPAFISWLGVTMYLGREAVMQTLRFVAESCARGTRIVFDFSLPDGLLRESERIRRDERARKVASLGEPWIGTFDPAELASDLKAMGFSTAVALAARDLNDRYFLGRTDGLRVVGSSGRIMSARV
jgi:methyltransferase (TIGR00027 family)